MNTAKNLQLLDAQSNNISPATNIESLYYEINQGGAVYRNAIYKHFPVYVKYNNNVDTPYAVGGGTGDYVYGSTNNGDTGYLKFKSPDTADSELLGDEKHVLVSSIEQTRLGGTRYYKLNVQTYDLTHILQQFPAKKWVNDVLSRHDASIRNITYESSIWKNNTELQEILTPYDVGGYSAGTQIGKINNTRINDLLDNLLFPDALPYVE